MGDTSLFLPTGHASNSPIAVKVHPVVIFTVLDHYIRRNESQPRVIGTLLGTFYEGVVEVKNCFPVPHHETDQVAVDMEFHKNMSDLHHRANPHEQIVGWYATGLDINEHSVLIHEFYWREMQGPPIHLLVDTKLTDNQMQIKSYISSALSLTSNDRTLGAQFQPIHVELSTHEAERIGVDGLIKLKSIEENQFDPGTLQSDLSNLELSVKKLLKMIEDVQAYTSKVADGTIKPDTKIGRFIAETVGGLPKLDPQTFETMFNNSLQDLLMVVYLANLTRTQLILSEKLINANPVLNPHLHNH